MPTEPQAITAAWLTGVLRSTGTLTHAVVRAVDAEALGLGQGFAGQLTRLWLTYAPGEAGAPRSLVAKFPAADPALRAVFGAIYAREVRFYQELAPEVPVRTPRCHFAALDPEGAARVLLLEDLGGRVGDNLAGCLRDDAVLALDSLATLHAAWWERPQLARLDWLPVFGADPDAAQARFRDAWAPFLAKLGALGLPLPGALQALGERFGVHGASVRRRLAGPPRTVVHGDYRLDNLVFGAPDGAPLAILDWQAALRGRGVSDVAYFLGFCLPPDRRRAWERGLLLAYHAGLVGRGVRGYSFRRCAHDLRLATFLLLTRLVLAVPVIDIGSERGRALTAVLLQRCAAFLEDHHAGELLPGEGAASAEAPAPSAVS